MDNIIYFYTGTGNSLYAARYFAEYLGAAELHPMINGPREPAAKRVGLVFPVHMWGIPGAVLEFIEKLKPEPDVFYFAAAVNAGEVSRTLIQLKEVLAKKGIKLSAGFDIAMPSNYIPWGGPGTADEVKNILIKADYRLKEAAEYLKSGASGRIDKGPLWQRIVYTWLYKSAFKWVNYMDKSFWVDDKCNGCAVCEKICPAANITMENDRPKWNKKCQQCLACIQWCPKEAIQYGKKTPMYERYHNPSVKTAEMIKIKE